MDSLHTHLKQYGHARANASLAKYTSFHIGGPAEFLVEVTDSQKLVELLRFVLGEGLDYFILGGGSNVLLPDEGIPGVTIINKAADFVVEGTTITVGAGMPLSTLVQKSIEHGLSGLEWAAGIPGTLGGAVRGNAGARYAFCGGEIKDTLTTVAVWQGNDVANFANSDCRFGYRDSVFKHTRDVVLGASFACTPGNTKTSLETVQKIILERRSKHASEPSAGSFFKNIMLSDWKRDHGELPPRFLEYKKIAAGWLVEQAGLKGFTVGKAMVSLSHANFIINTGGATAEDVLAVVEAVKSQVYNIYGIHLEEEVQIVR